MALYDNYNTGDDDVTSTQTTAIWLAQTFTTIKSYAITSVKIKIYSAGVNVDLTVELYAVDGSSLPTGSALAAGTIAKEDIPATEGAAAFIECTFSSSYTLSISTEYAIVIRWASAPGDFVHWRTDSDPGGYADGIYSVSVNTGSTWTASDDRDLLFECYGDFIPIVNKTFSKKFVVIGNHEVWYEDSAGSMTELTAANGDINTVNPLTAFELLEKIFIVNGTNLKVADFGNIKIVTDGNGIGSHPPDFNTVLTGDNSGAKMIVDYITALTGVVTIYGKKISGTFTASEKISGTDDDANDIDFDISSDGETLPPHWYDWTVYGNSTAFGVMPDQANEGCNWKGRACLTADKDYPHQWYLSRQKNPWDWNYVANDSQAPVAGNDADAGEVGDIMVVNIPYKDDYLIQACANTLYYMVGDPAENGVIVELDLTNGILGSRAWCWDNRDNLYILGTTGILKIPKGFGPPENLTAISWPDFIEDLAYNSTIHRIVMGFDRKRNGLKISKTTLADGTNSCWWYDFKAEGLFPESYPEECGAYCMFYYESVNPTYSGLLEGCFDGYIRQSNDDAVDDDIGDTDEAIDSYYTLGPIRMGPETKEGVFTSLLGIPAGGRTSGSLTNSSDIDWSLWTAETADELVEKLLANTSPKIAGTITALGTIRGARKRRSVRGMWMGIRLGNDTAAETWSLERLQANIKAGGRMK